MDTRAPRTGTHSRVARGSHAHVVEDLRPALPGRDRRIAYAWLQRQRVVAAQRLLERTDEPIELIADQCGFGSAAVLRQHFGRVVGANPLAYRRTFGAA